MSGGESYLYPDIGSDETENLGSDRSAERSNIFEYNHDRTFFGMYGTERILPYRFICLACAINIPPATRNYEQLYKTVLLLRCQFRPWLLATEILKAVGDIWGRKRHSCSRASLKVTIFPFFKVVRALTPGIAYSEMEERMRTGSVSFSP